MKYGIITYTSAQNWGAMLQSYAFIAYLKGKGCDCQLINYREFDNRKFKPRKQIKDILYSAAFFKQNSRRVRRYEKFRKKYLKLSEEVISSEKLKNLNDIYDVFITGSDQLWNCETEICHDFYLEFADDNKILASYAPSFGQDKIPEKFEEEVSRLLKRYDIKSVREQSGAEIVQKLTGEEIPVVCDPTLLLRKEKWLKIANPKIQEKGYIFIYTTQVSREVIEIVAAYKKSHKDCRVITPYALPGIDAEVRKDIGPAEFLSYVKNADYIIGTSFHAVMFSLIFEKNFCVVPHSSTGARVKDILKKLGMEKHLAENGVPETFPILQVSDYQEKLNNYVEASKAYIDQMLSIKQK